LHDKPLSQDKVPLAMQVEVFPDVAIHQALDPADGLLLIGDTLKATIVVYNRGAGAATEVNITQILSLGMQYVYAAPSGEDDHT
jgi:uncharacterized repeat protein (TIGR01451 family)